MNCAHLFNGIGGFALAAHWMGWSNIMHCEIDPFCNQVMNHHFPNSYQHEDIRTTDFTIWRGKIDLLTGGFPCQPYSVAGNRKGKDDTRHLWPEMHRAIREIQPGWIVGENVRGLVNWKGGLVFDEVQAGLETEGYEVLPFLLPACGVNAPHRRERVWFIAYADSSRFCGHNQLTEDRCEKKEDESKEQWEERNEAQRERFWINTGGNDAKRDASNTRREGLQKRVSEGFGSDGEKNATLKRGTTSRTHTKTDWSEFPTQSPVCNRNDGIPGGLVDITFSKWRKESIKALGNAVVPQIILKIFETIQNYNNEWNSVNFKKLTPVMDWFSRGLPTRH